MSDVLNLEERISSRDEFEKSEGRSLRTEILAGYDLYKDEFGCSQLGEQIIRPQHNKITVGGLLYLLGQAFGVTPDIAIEDISEQYQIGLGAKSAIVETSKVCLFNIGLEGCGDSYADIKEVLDQQNIVTDGMIPFRVVDVGADVKDNSRTDDGPYWLKKTVTTTVNGVDLTKDWYYGKQFEIDPTTNSSDVRLVSRWKDAEIGKDGTLVTDNPEKSLRTEGIESYVEVVARISAADLREYFKIYKDSAQARFNSIGLCAGTKCLFEDGTYEYTDVKQITVLNFSNEMLHFEKDMSIIYRIYLT